MILSEVYNLEYYKNKFSIKAEQTSFDNSISGVYSDDVQGAMDEIKSAVGYSKKNLLKNEATTQTITGVTFTVNSDNSVTVNGTNTGSGNAKFKIATFTYKANEKYILNGCPTGGSVESGQCIQSEDTVSHHDVGKGIEISYDNEKANYIYIRVTSGATVNNVTFYPMIRYASIEDGTYEPYVADVQTQIDSKANVKDLRLMELGGSDVGNKPWINLKEKWNTIPKGLTCVEILAGGRYGCLVWKMNEDYGKAIIFSYYGDTKNAHVSVNAGTWKWSWTTQQTENTF